MNRQDFHQQSYLQLHYQIVHSNVVPKKLSPIDDYQKIHNHLVQP